MSDHDILCDDCPVCEFIRSLPDFDDPELFDERERVMKERFRAGEGGYGYVAVATDDPSGAVRRVLRHEQHLWQAVQDCGDGTYYALVATGQQEELEAVRQHLESTLTAVSMAARIDFGAIATVAVGTELCSGETYSCAALALELRMELERDLREESVRPGRSLPEYVH